MTSRATQQNTAAHASSSDHSAFDELATFAKAASDSLRLEVLRVLHNNSFGVLELCHILDVKQSALSHHLKILATAELVGTRREGNSIFYYRQANHSDSPYHTLQQTLFESIDELPLNKPLQSRIKYIQKERAASSKAFFREQAECFEQQQERIANFSVYGESLLDLLGKSNLSSRNIALEVGPGNGECLPKLAQLFKSVIALDNSSEMLQRAKLLCDSKKTNNVEFIHGDTDIAIERKIKADCIVLNMVLHHTPSPAELFDELRQLLKPNGVLLMTEICRHQQDWVKQACGDLWLGFESEELLQWAHNVGFRAEQSVYQALRNGFQIQMHRFCINALQKPSL